MEIGVKFNDDDFLLFVAESRTWITRYGLNDWDITFIFGVPETDNDSMACVSCNHEAMRATVYFNRENDSDDVLARDKNELIKHCAFHEITEIVLEPLEVLARSRYWNDASWESANHAVLYRIQKALKEQHVKT